MSFLLQLIDWLVCGGSVWLMRCHTDSVTAVTCCRTSPEAIALPLVLLKLSSISRFFSKFLQISLLDTYNLMCIRLKHQVGLDETIRQKSMHSTLLVQNSALQLRDAIDSSVCVVC